MAKEPEKLEKWAVENHSHITNKTCRYMEAVSDWAAKAMCEKANTYFKENNRSCVSTVIKLK